MRWVDLVKVEARIAPLKAARPGDGRGSQSARVSVTETGGQLSRSSTGGVARLVAGGVWTIATADRLEPSIDEAVNTLRGTVEIDLGSIVQIDTAGAWLITRLERELSARGVSVSLVSASENARRLLEALAPAERDVPPPPETIGVVQELLEAVGRTMVRSWEDLKSGLGILGGVVRGLSIGLRHPRRMRFTSIIFHMEQTGLRAVPIIALMSFLIGAIIAQQSAYQLAYFGADIFVVDLVGILVLRELGVLLTAIMVAGRSGSAFTAEIGSMKMREEIDALSVIGLDPLHVLILPRLIALILVLPLLTFIADVCALAGGGMMSWAYLGLPPDTFITRLRDAVALNTLFVGLIKAPFMALIIGIVAAAEGLRVAGSAESLGTHTTSSVVKSIFMVIVVDGIFAMYFAAVRY